MGTATKMKLELKHLAPYLPYGLKGLCKRPPHYESFEINCKLLGLSPMLIVKCYDKSGNKWKGKDELLFTEFKPILRPLSDLALEDAKEHNYPDEGHLERSLLSGHAPYSVWIEFVKEHYDVFGLIEKGLAIDINTLKNELL